jgi:hypothetical protein
MAEEALELRYTKINCTSVNGEIRGTAVLWRCWSMEMLEYGGAGVWRCWSMEVLEYGAGV